MTALSPVPYLLLVTEIGPVVRIRDDTNIYKFIMHDDESRGTAITGLC